MVSNSKQGEIIMQIELSLDELKKIRYALSYTAEPENEALYGRVVEAVSELEELESLDLNECEGGACKL